MHFTIAFGLVLAIMAENDNGLVSFYVSSRRRLVSLVQFRGNSECPDRSVVECE